MNFIKLILFKIIIFLRNNVYAGSRCPNFGKLNYTCVTYDYCDASLGLVCGDGTCGIDCPLNWKEVNGSCYYISSNRLTYNDAVKYCQSYKANLFKLNSINDLKTLTTTPESLVSIWTSAYSNDYLKFTWFDGTILNRNNSAWCKNFSSFGLNNTCVELHNSTCLINTNCAKLNFFLCQIVMKNCTKTTCSCKSGYYQSSNRCVKQKLFNETCYFDSECVSNSGLKCLNNTCVCYNNEKWDSQKQNCQRCQPGWINVINKCYLFISNLIDFKNASDSCISKNAKLAVLSNQTVFEVIQNVHLTYIGYEIWIGATCNSGNNCNWDNTIQINSFCSSKTGNCNNACVYMSINSCLLCDACTNNKYALCEEI